MRTMMKACIPVEAGNEAISSGKFGEIMGSLVENLHPEAVYCVAENGQRAAYVVFDLKEPSQIPVIAEPLFMALNASIVFSPCMTIDDVQAGLAQLPRARTADDDKIGV
jgi:hypothetical protein